ncbi:hypothetical protein X971_1662 [Agrobacterium tumefaciens LBA4213 (Ach5)]|nr:hypothetical protein X971_1662 [Agrobacterium tumefaciens LBA4213 (Ach5)]
MAAMVREAFLRESSIVMQTSQERHCGRQPSGPQRIGVP